jgi:hypothetical protein
VAETMIEFVPSNAIPGVEKLGRGGGVIGIPAGSSTVPDVVTRAA